MKPYRAIMAARFQALLQYRAAAFAGLGTQIFFGLILVYVLEAFYRHNTRPQPIDIRQLVTYVWLGQAFLAMLPWTADRDIQAMMRDGSVAYELLRPLDLYAFWYARILALRTAPTLLRAVPMFLVAMVFLDMQPPPSPASGAAFLAATLGSLLLGCAFTALMTISMLWTVAGDGVTQLLGAATLALSGMLLPLPLFPDWAQPVLHALPFAGLADWPFRLYVGHIPPSEVGSLLARQMAWTAALVVLGRWTLARGMRRVVVQGG